MIYKLISLHQNIADDSQYLIGWINFQSGNFDEAIVNYTKLFSNYPQSHSIANCLLFNW